MNLFQIVCLLLFICIVIDMNLKICAGTQNIPILKLIGHLKIKRVIKYRHIKKIYNLNIKLIHYNIIILKEEYFWKSGSQVYRDSL